MFSSLYQCQGSHIIHKNIRGNGTSTTGHTNKNRKLNLRWHNEIENTKNPKAIDMRFYWVRDRVKKHFRVIWKSGVSNLGNYFTKHLLQENNKVMIPYLSTDQTSDRILKGCVNLSKPPREHKVNLYPQDAILIQKPNP